MRFIPKPITPRLGRGRWWLTLGILSLTLNLFSTLSVWSAEGNTSIADATPAEATSTETSPKTFWQKHGKIEDPNKAPSLPTDTPIEKPAEQIPLTLETLRIPVQHGSIKDTYQGHEPIIIHIQDAHAQYEAQKHLSGILEHLIVMHGLSLVLVEGGSRNDSLSYMRAYAPLAKRKEVAEEFLKSGKISGENYLDLTTDYDFTVYGIEQPELYDQNMGAFLSVEKVQPDALVAMQGFQQAVAALKENLYPKEVKDLEIRELEVQAGRVPLAKHYQALADEAKKLKLPVEESAFPNFLRFLKASQLEAQLDFKKVETERTQFLEALTKNLPKSEMDKLLKQSVELKQGLISPATFYGHLRSHIRPEQAAEYPILSRYIEYLGLFDGIDHAALFGEVERQSDRVKASYFKTKDQATLALVAKDVGVLADLLELKLTPESYDYYNAHKSEFKPDRWADTLRELASKQKLPLNFGLTPGPINAAIPAMSSFYEVARKRDLAMVENALKRIEEFKVPYAVLIAGGFHTPVFERLFKERKVSYAVVAPKVGKVTEADTEKYHRVLKETYVPMSDEYRKKMGIPAASPTPADLRAEGESGEGGKEETGMGTKKATASEVRPVAYAEAAGE